jgi:hypothetical protein
MNNDIKKPVKWGTPVWWITITALVVVAIAEYYAIAAWFHSKNWIILAVSVGILLFFLCFLLESPCAIELKNKELILHKLRGKFVIAYDQIVDVSYYKPDRSETRCFGSGGVFGFIGKFNNAKIGHYQSYVCNYSQAFLIQTKRGRKYVFSCENRELIVEAIKKHIQS